MGKSVKNIQHNISQVLYWESIIGNNMGITKAGSLKILMLYDFLELWLISVFINVFVINYNTINVAYII